MTDVERGRGAARILRDYLGQHSVSELVPLAQSEARNLIAYITALEAVVGAAWHVLEAEVNHERWPHRRFVFEDLHTRLSALDGKEDE